MSRHTAEELPVPAARRDERGARPVRQSLAEGEGRIHWRGREEDASVGADAQKTREDNLRQREWLIRSRQPLQPRRIALMLGGVLAVCIDEDVPVGQLHGLRSGCEALEVVGFEQPTSCRCCAARNARPSRTSPARTRAPPSASAAFARTAGRPGPRACLRRSLLGCAPLQLGKERSSRVIVVRMMRDRTMAASLHPGAPPRALTDRPTFRSGRSSAFEDGRRPQDVNRTQNAYLAVAALRCVRDFNQRASASGGPLIRRVLCPGLATGIGRMDPFGSARQSGGRSPRRSKPHHDVTQHFSPGAAPVQRLPAGSPRAAWRFRRTSADSGVRRPPDSRPGHGRAGLLPSTRRSVIEPRSGRRARLHRPAPSPPRCSRAPVPREAR